MAYRGKIITNPVSKQSIEFVTTTKDSDGQVLEMVSRWAPHSRKPIAHYHPFQDEIFTVLEGELTLVLERKALTLKKKESIHIPAGTVHAMWNESEKHATVAWKVFPAMNTEYLLETATGLAADGKTGESGLPGILQTTLIARKYSNEFRLAKPPYIIQRVLFALLTPFALLSGKRSLYRKYLD